MVKQAMQADASTEYREHLAGRLRAACELQGVSAAELGRRIGVSKQSAADYLAGRVTVPGWVLLRTLEELRIPLSRLTA